MKKLIFLLTLLSITVTATQAQLLKSKVAAPTKEGTAAVASVDERRYIEGVPVPSNTGMRSAKRISQYRPSGYIYGTRIFSSVWSDYDRVGLYMLSPDQPHSVPIYEGSLFNTSRGVVYFEGKLWLSHVERNMVIGGGSSVEMNTYVSHYVFNMYTGEIETYINPGYPASTATSMVYDRYTGIIYGFFSDETFTKEYFGTLDPTTGRRTGIAELPVELSGMVIDNDHRMWAIERKTGTLYEVDMVTGTLRNAGNTGLTSFYMNSACIDPITGVYLYNTCNGYDSSLYAIDTETATATRVYAFPTNDEWTSMWMLPQLSDAVPAAPTNVQATFNGLEGTVSFKIPAKLANGQPMMGDQATYKVYIDGVCVTTGEANFGANVSAPVSVAHGGSFIVAIALSYEEGESPIVRQTVIIGDAAVPAPTNVTLAKSGNNFQLTWDAVALDGVTYSIVRYPDATPVASGLAATSFSEPAPNAGRESYFYTVTAHLGNAQSQTARSNYLVNGPFTLPYSNHFESKERANELTFINANNDKYVWTYAVNADLHGNQGIYVPMNNRELSFWEQLMGVVPETDDWAVTPGLPLEAGKIYTVTYKLFSMYASSEYIERYEVKMGTSPTVAAMTTVLQSPTNVLTGNLAPREDRMVFTVPADGIYYIGLHGISQGGYWFGCLGIDVSEGYDTSAPYFPMSFEVTPDPNGSLQAHVTLQPSGWNAQRRDLDGYDRMELYANGQLVHTWPSPEARSTITADIDLPHDGNYEFEAVPYGLSGTRGIPRKVTAYIGVRPPSNVTGASISTTDTPGEVTVTWAPVTTNVDKVAINPDLLTYNVYDATEQPLGENLTSPNLTFQAIDYDHDPQQFVRYYVISHYGGFFCSDAAFTPFIPLGKPYRLPFYETSSTLTPCYAWLMSGDIGWDLISDNSVLAASDGDGTLWAMIGNEVGQVGVLTSAKIHISGNDPNLTFDFASMSGNNNTLTVKVICDGETTPLGNVTLSTGAVGDSLVWQPLEYSLEAFAGRDIQIQFTGAIVSHASVIIDAVKVTSTPDTLITGDLNGDGNVDVTDVSLLIDVVLGKGVTLADGAVTDLNNDGNVDVTDVSLLIDIILGIIQ